MNAEELSRAIESEQLPLGELRSELQALESGSFASLSDDELREDIKKIHTGFIIQAPVLPAGTLVYRAVKVTQRPANKTQIILALVVPATLLAQQSKAEKEVLAVVEEIRQSIIKGGPDYVAAMEKYYVEDGVRIPGYGRLLTGADMVTAAKKGETTVESLEYSDLKVRVYGNWAIVTGTETGKGVQVGVPWTGTFRFSRVFVKRDGIWKTMLYQDTPIAEPANAQASNDAPPSYVADPAVYKVIDENDQFLVISAKRPVGHRDAWHSHLALTWYNLTDCPSRVHTPDGKTVEFMGKAGEYGLMSAVPSHALENIGTAECDQIIVERK